MLAPSRGPRGRAAKTAVSDALPRRALGALSGPLKACVGVSGTLLERSSGGSWGPLEPFWGHPGAVQGPPR
eukprot:4778245-Pyramimonas_sp.AAC.1